MISSLLGCWKFIGSQVMDLKGGILTDPASNASGLIIYNINHIAVQISIPQNCSVEGGLKVKFNYISYCGTYVFEESSQIVTHNVMFSNIPDMVGHSVQRKVERIGIDNISLTNVKPEQYGMSEQVYRKLFWKKID